MKLGDWILRSLLQWYNQLVSGAEEGKDTQCSDTASLVTMVNQQKSR